METVYIETTIPSYLAARPSRQELLAHRQRVTHSWWSGHRGRYDLRASVAVRREASEGDPEVAARRLAYLDEVPDLDETPEVYALATRLFDLLDLPRKAEMDATHLSFAILHKVGYLLTWNCTHLANASLQRKLIEYGGASKLHIPVICTPETLIFYAPND